MRFILALVVISVLATGCRLLMQTAKVAEGGAKMAQGTGHLTRDKGTLFNECRPPKLNKKGQIDGRCDYSTDAGGACHVEGGACGTYSKRCYKRCYDRSECGEPFVCVKYSWQKPQDPGLCMYKENTKRCDDGMICSERSNKCAKKCSYEGDCPMGTRCDLGWCASNA